MRWRTETDRGCSLSLESGKVDALMRLRQLAGKMVVALGGQVEWKE